MKQIKAEWILYPVCGNKTRTMIREDTELKNFPLYCPKCKEETIINVQDMKITLAEWERQTSRKPPAASKEQRRPPERQSVLKHLHEIQEMSRQKPPQRQRKKSVDRDSR